MTIIWANYLIIEKDVDRKFSRVNNWTVKKKNLGLIFLFLFLILNLRIPYRIFISSSKKKEMETYDKVITIRQFSGEFPSENL